MPHDDRQPPRPDDWCVFMAGGQQSLCGEVWGHPRIVDGRTANTSPLLWITDDRAPVFYGNDIERITRSTPARLSGDLHCGGAPHSFESARYSDGQ